MELVLKNIGKITEASVEINSITVIAGENNTGKSTISRALFAVFNSFYNIQNQMESLRADSVGNAIYRLFLDNNIAFHCDPDAFYKETRMIVSNTPKYENDIDALKEDILNLCKQWNSKILEKLDDDTINNVAERVQNILTIPEDDLKRSIVSRKLYWEFNGQVCNIYTDEPGEIYLKIKKDKLSIFVKDSEESEMTCPGELSLKTEAVYIDDPFVLDKLRSVVYRGKENSDTHQGHLLNKLSLAASGNDVDNLITKKKLNNIYSKISSVCDGEIVKKDMKEYGYKKEGSDKILNICNLSSGLKTFAIIKRLLMNGTIENNGTMILDEPEIHLHPEWQVLLAELIVLIQKEFSMHILINTHSPYFLRAIQVYAAKNSIADKCKYYLSSEEADQAKIKDATDNIDEIYAKLAKPLQKLEDDSCSDDPY